MNVARVATDLATALCCRRRHWLRGRRRPCDECLLLVEQLVLTVRAEERTQVVETTMETLEHIDETATEIRTLRRQGRLVNDEAAWLRS